MGAVKTFTLKMKLAKKIKQNRLGGWSWAYLIIYDIIFWNMFSSVSWDLCLVIVTILKM